MQNSWFKLIFLISLVFLSCKKNSENNSSVTLNAIVVDYATRQPIPGLTIHIVSGGFRLHFFSDPWDIRFADTITTSIPAINYITDDSITTNGLGHFSAQFTPQFLEGMYTFPRFFTKVDTLIRVSSKSPLWGSDDTNTDTVYLDKRSLLVINMQKLSPVFSNDTVFQNVTFLDAQFSPQYSIPSLKGQIGLANRTITNEFSYTFFKKADIEWRYYRNGLQKSHRDTVVLHQGVNNINITF
ncbi:hypothetical protein [Ferruginibacter sp.]